MKLSSPSVVPHTQLAKCQLIGPFRQLITMADLPNGGPISDEQLEPIPEAGILVKNGLVHTIGPYSELLHSAKLLESNITHLQEDFVCLPGMIDSHTHICYGGSRARDYAMRNSGKTYQEIAKSGGGIWDTVLQTRSSNQQLLEQELFKRVSRHLGEGVTTVEVKSGYGLSVDEELKMLRAIKAVDAIHKSDLISTCLAAHILPKDFDGSHKDYLEEISTHLFPILRSKELTNRIDIFIEDGAFSDEDAREYLLKAKEQGFDVTIHADQFNAEGSHIAVEVGALSADHLEVSGKKEIERLANSDVVATALPGASLGLGHTYTPAREILNAGGALAIASDWNPGSAPMGDLLLQAAILGANEKLSNAEVLAGITYRSANALGLEDRGKLEKGYLADFILFPCKDYREILYHQGKLKPGRVWKRGELIVPCL